MQEVDFHWFLEHYQELYEEYGKCYVIVKNKHVLGVSKTMIEGVKQAEQTEEPGTFIVQCCNGDESGYTAHFGTLWIG